MDLQRTKNTFSGFTLLELMVSISIMAITLSLGIPSFGEFIQNQRLRSENQRLHIDLLFARSMAVNQGQQVIICASAGGNSCADTGNWGQGWMIFIDSNNDREYQQQEQRLRIAAAMDSLQARSSIYRRKIRFYPDGSAAGSAAKITICDFRGRNYARELVIANSGRVRQIKRVAEGISLNCG
ncbi:MAG: GspH/FimT family pseudopilin [Xanthomonadales bacterium]|nr:GspH/FimT family pseudopilin [Xanthomonadales bacterium]